MARRKTQFVQDNYYHLYNRGANRQNIFLCDENYRFLLRRIKKYIARDNITVVAYCLMPNHYHLLVRQDSNISISDCMQAIFNSYTKAFNKMHNHSGTLFEGPFESIHVDSDQYVLHLCRYIHRNPIDGEKPLVQNLSDWPYSNYPEWIGIRNGTLVDLQFIHAYFPDKGQYQNFVLEYTPPKKLVQGLKSYLFD